MMAGPARGFADTLERQYKFLQSLNSEPTEQEKAALNRACSSGTDEEYRFSARG